MSAISIEIPTGLPPLRSGVAFETASIRDNTTDERPAKGHARWSAFRVPRSYKLARRSRLSARKICRVVGIAFAAIGRNRRIRAKWPLHRDAFRRVVTREFCSNHGTRRAVLLNPRDRRGDQVVVRIEHWRIGLTGIEITRAAEGVRARAARAMAHTRRQIEANEFVSRVGLSLQYAVVVVDGVARLD